MSTLYKPLLTQHLPNIQEEVLNILSFETLQDIAWERLVKHKERGTIHWNIPPVEYMFEQSPSLFNFYKEIGISDFPEAIIMAVNFTPPDFLGTIHIDGLSDIATYSINIPIANCEGTYLNTYDVINPEKELSPYSLANKSNPYRYWKPEDCKLVSTNETVTPYLINVESPHQFSNPNMNTYRYMLISKIKKEYENVNDIVAKLFNLG
jgi:hypothetical protein